MQMINGECYAFNSVVSELDVFIKLFDHITWIGYDYSDQQPDGTIIRIKYPQVKPILLRRSGGKGILQKLGILLKLPNYIFLTLKYALKADVIHSRGPSVPMFIALLISLFYRKPIWWFKYATNWAAPHPSIAYRMQRWLLKKKVGDCKVTINGFWPSQPSHCLSFENPCLTESDLPLNRMAAQYKSYQAPYRLVFIGRLEQAKGVETLLDALQKNSAKGKIAHMDFIGSGPLQETIERRMKSIHIPYTLHGFLPKEQVFQLLAKAHFLCLPSHSEGFPKVIAEAASFGVIPVVSNVGSIPHYIKSNQNGWVWDYKGQVGYGNVLGKALQTEEQHLKNIVKQVYEMPALFTFERYAHRIQEEILETKE